MIDPHIARLVEVARAYYLEDKTQAEIAQGLGISRSQVSRYLTAAREMGLVQIRIVDLEGTPNALAQRLKDRFPHLEGVVIAPTFSTEIDAIRAMIGRFAANYLLQILQPSQCLALGCGHTLRAMVDALPKHRLTDVKVVQAMGNIGHEVHKIDYNEIARHTAESLGGKVYYLSAPAILGNGSGRASDLIAANPGLQYSFSIARQADIYVVGLGSLDSDQLYVRAGLVQQAELDDLRSRHAVGDICGRFFTLAGQEIHSPFGDRIVGIELSDLKHAQYAIGVAGGADKVAPLLGALRGSFINVIVSDESTVRALLEADKEMQD